MDAYHTGTVRFVLSRRAAVGALLAATIGQATGVTGWGRARAGAQEATPVSDLARTSLLRAVFAATELPTGGAECVFYRMTLEPGVSTSVLAGPYCGCPGQKLASGIGVEVVDSGSYAVRSDGPVRVRRSGAAEEEALATGNVATLGPGDAAVYLDYAAGGEFHNAGSEDVVVLGVAILSSQRSGGTPVPKQPEGMEANELNRAYASIWKKLPEGPITVDLRRLTLTPGEQVTLTSAFGLETVYVESGEITWGDIPAGEDAPSSPLRYGPSGRTSFLDREAGNRATIEAIGDEPASVLLLSIVPGDDLATPAAST